MPHILSTEKQFATIYHGDRVEDQKDKLLKYIKDEESHMVFVENDLIDPCNETKQFGNPMTSTEMETRLKKCLPLNITFIDNPFNPTKKAIVRVKNLIETETICAYERGIQPEHSVMMLVTKEVPDADVINRRKSISRKDLGRFEFDSKRGYVFDETETRPGFKKIKQIGRELKRGWRTVLLRLLGENLITLADVEKYFNSDNTAEWAKFTGKQAGIKSWN